MGVEMIMNRRACLSAAGAGLVLAASGAAGSDVLADPWPELVRECRPWAYMHWPGSAVDEENLARELRRYRDAGLGGVHVIPIYGVKGAESRGIPFLSDRWMEVFAFTVAEAGRLDLGVDMTTGSGWCFGGPTVSGQRSIQSLDIRMIDAPSAGTPIPKLEGWTPIDLIAVGPDGVVMSVLDRLNPDGSLRWTPGDDGWKLGILATRPAGTKVKRAAPGGEGFMLNPIDPFAMRDHLAWVSAAIDAPGSVRPRAMYHDSFEYYGTGWSPDYLDAFEARRGYRLQDRAALLAGIGDADAVARVKCDYRETASDLIVEDVFPAWTAWSRERGMRTRIQAHGAPANLLDFYALADIPETEMFGRGARDPLISKLASSAAHLAGRKLVAAETGTWMAEHFCETLEEMKGFADLMFVSGVNHVFYHGTCYSPDDAAWPGWLFYAATQMNPRNPIWRDAPALNAYIARCQSVLQSGAPDNDLLLYWPIHDIWHKSDGALDFLTVHRRSWLTDQPVGRAAREMWDSGYGFDYVSDRLLAGLRVERGGLHGGGGSWKAVVVPGAIRMPEATLRRLMDFAREGATVIFAERMPEDVPGMGRLDERRAIFRSLLAELRFSADGGGGALEAQVGAGRVLTGSLRPALDAAGIIRETMADHVGVHLIRRRHAEGKLYFISNLGTNVMEAPVSLAVAAHSVVVMDPMSGGFEAVIARGSTGGTELDLRLEPGQSAILKTYETREWPPAAARALFQAPGATVMEVDGPWTVSFREGGPVLPNAMTMAGAGSWAHAGDADAERFGGTAVYSAEFDLPAGVDAGTALWIELGRVCHSARVRLNETEIGRLIMHPYRTAIPGGLTRPTGNRLEIEVTNLAANRIRDLDRRKVGWKIFHNINFVNIRYKPFDASAWPIMTSGLLGPVRIMRAPGGL